MKDMVVDKLLREAIERLERDNAVFCDDSAVFDSIRTRILDQADGRDGGRGRSSKNKVRNK